MTHSKLIAESNFKPAKNWVEKEFGQPSESFLAWCFRYDSLRWYRRRAYAKQMRKQWLAND